MNLQIGSMGQKEKKNPGVIMFELEGIRMSTSLLAIYKRFYLNGSKDELSEQWESEVH